ncbi:hypothetical protein EPD60_01350 [Flaviaesturariibacter flavus]|uniref:DUF4136 domain-containing protein n=1 Tax=Flaviaesturariibacter flavus TaxID=2502780 RepID=A0A4R1BNP2_9BACT|nr:hypothetical protein [Flaviaesturariibacter flavus]TCJ19091.1 hypothetical protein EPD60_01350 [Flaviaesturariibacter flavus]
MIPIRSLFLFILIAMAQGCANTHVTSAWKTPGLEPASYRNIMVFGIVRDADTGLRAAMENHLVGDLRSRGYTAFSGLERYGAGRFRGMNETEAASLLQADGVDAVMTIVLLDKRKERHYEPAQIQNPPNGRYQNRMWMYYGALYDRIQTPGYYAESTRYYWESNFYDLAANRLLYSVQTESFDPPNTNRQAHEYGLAVVGSLVKSGVLAKTGAKGKTE